MGDVPEVDEVLDEVKILNANVVERNILLKLVIAILGVMSVVLTAILIGLIIWLPRAGRAVTNNDLIKAHICAEAEFEKRLPRPHTLDCDTVIR